MSESATHETDRAAATEGAVLLAGRSGLIVGVANERSIAWGIAQRAAAAGAKLALTYQGEALERRGLPLAERVRELGYELSGAELNRVFQEFKRLADLKKTVFDEDIEALVTRTANRPGRFELVDLDVRAGTRTTPQATVEMKGDGELRSATATGRGPGEAVLPQEPVLERVGLAGVDEEFAQLGLEGGMHRASRPGGLLQHCDRTVQTEQEIAVLVLPRPNRG